MKKYLLIAAAFLGLAACQPTPEPEEVNPELTVDVEEIAATAAEESKTITLTSNTQWTIECSADWVYCDPVMGQDNASVTVQINANEGYDERNTYIRIKGEGLTNPILIPITQAAAKGLLTEELHYEVGAEGGDITVEFKTNVAITADIKADWITAAADTRGLEEKTMTFTVAANEGYEPRTGTIVLSGEGVDSETITVVQAETGMIAVSKEDKTFGAEGGEFSVAVRTNIEFSVEMDEECNWISIVNSTRAVVDTTVTFKVEANSTIEERSASIYFKSDLGTDTIAVQQAGNRNVTIEFANANFKTFLRKRGFDTNNDKEFSIDELEAITELVLWSRVKKDYYTFQTDLINDLSDVQYLTNLEVLDIQGVPASLTQIDLSKNTKLQKFNCANTAISEIDLSNNTELVELNLSATKIREIDLSKNTKLQTLHIGGCSQLTELDVTMLPELTMLNCAYSKIAALDVTKNTKLEALYCSGNQLTELNISTLALLERLVCDDNAITTLDASSNSGLKSLTCTRNKLTSINVSGLANLKRLAVSQNTSLNELSIAGNTALNFLHAAYTNMSTIDCSPATNLWMLNANDSKLTSVGIASNAALRGLRLNNNQLTSLDISKGDLRYLWADGNSTLAAIKVADDFNPASSITFFKDANTKWDGGTRPEFKDLSENGTANCYIINKAGESYMFKATVKGNGYDPITGKAAEAIAPTKAYILWGHRRANGAGSDNTQLNTSILRQSVELRDGYICFTTPATMEDGNFVIVATDDKDNILWSWHMWCAQDYDYQASAIDVDVYGDSYKIMDRNLGAFAAPTLASPSGSEDFEFTHGLIYQWGRKDPFAAGNVQTPTSWGYMSWIDWCNPDGSLLKSPTFYIVGRSDRSAYKYDPYIVPHNLNTTAEILAHSVKNPMTYFTGNNWATSTATSNGQTEDWGKLWGNQSASGAGVKTMYDPCPVGYTVASPDRLKFISATGESTPVGATWQVNATMNLNNADGTAVSPNPLKELPYGLFFYTKGTRTESSTPADKTVVFLPKHNWSNSQGSEKDDKFICMYTNAPSNQEMWGGQPYKAVVTYSGYGSFKEAQWSNAAEAACGLPVRCVSESTESVNVSGGIQQ